MATVKHGHYIDTLPWGYRGATLRALQMAEEAMGRPVYTVEVFQVFKAQSWFPCLFPMMLFFPLQDLYRNDEVLADKELNLWSVNSNM